MAAKQVAQRVKVEMLFDILSPYTYIQLELFRRNRVNWPRMDLQLKPVLLAGLVMGSKNTPPFACPAKGKYVSNDLKMLAECYRIPVTMPDDFPKLALSNATINVQRFLVTIQPQISSEAFENLVRNLFIAHFAPGSVNMKDTNVIQKIATESDIDSQIVKAALESISSDEAKSKLKSATDEAVKKGAFGLPTMFVHIKDQPTMVWGSDRMSLLQHLLGESSKPILNEQ